MSQLRIRGGKGPLQGRIRVPGDKSIGHRALLFAALARADSRITGLSEGLDNRATAEALRSLGVGIKTGEVATQVAGVGLSGLKMARGALDCGNSGTSMRLLSGLLAGQRFGSRLVGDESLSRRPMMRVVGPLRARGALIAGAAGKKAEEVYAPISIAPLVEGEALSGLEYDMPVASAQVKSALLLSGLYATGPTRLAEPVVSRDHTERMMSDLGVPIQVAGSMVHLEPGEGDFDGWDGFEWEVPGDLSSAAFPLAGALMLSGSRVAIDRVGTNPTRTGLLDALRAMGARVSQQSLGAAAGGEPFALLSAEYGSLRRGLIAGELLVRMIDEVPIFAALAATAAGRTEIRDAQELRVKESDRLRAMAETLRAFGVPLEELPDGLVIQGGAALHPARIASRGDHRVAMSAAILALTISGESIVEDTDCVNTSFPGFAQTMRSLGADITEQPS
ncbi:MAG: 3-phosphoshikimate 1-carboxyvinyltransferase [Deltaproteobacteria bacterium]|nr:3-phosphoshikimate 1-carboxyvinyltransferase [Deltaproteobacteria bacterium]